MGHLLRVTDAALRTAAVQRNSILKEQHHLPTTCRAATRKVKLTPHSTPPLPSLLGGASEGVWSLS